MTTLFEKQGMTEEKKLVECPFCKGTQIIKRGRRQKKYESVQIYFCQNCDKKFTASITKNKTFPLRLILDSITLYNRLNSLEQSAQIVSDKYGIAVNLQNISNHYTYT